MNTTKDIINENNYIVREIKEIKGMNENFEIEDNLTIIHEIKDFKPKQIEDKIIPLQNNNAEVEIRLEGEHITKNTDQNSLGKTSEKKYLYPKNPYENLCPNCKEENLCPECKGERLCPECKLENLCPECKKIEQYNQVLCDECKNEKIKDSNIEKEDQVHYGIVDAPFLETKKENSSPEHISNLMDAIFELLKTEDMSKDYDNLVNVFKGLKEAEKNEIIEGIKIKIDNEEQEKRFNNLLKYL